ncbi:MAG: arylsulfatase A-like enzyme [Verrucomicrobiales bacterium]|jgi:arylsulfatase A-like enzyme
MNPMRSFFLFFLSLSISAFAEKPHIVLVMTDDQGYGETGYYGHPVLKTPNLDAMAANGLRLDRFYAGAPVCSPTRASVLTGRSNQRTGVESHGYALRLQEKTLAPALREAGYATGHFGKWHLNGLRGPGVPVLKGDAHGPGKFGFDTWLSVTNFFDLDPIMSRGGEFEEFAGDSSEIIVAEALKFIEKQAGAGKPTFSVIWYGTPHSPFRASDQDRAPFANLDEGSANHYGELVAMDRSIGALRDGLRGLGIEKDTLIWFNSDNGGLPKIKPGAVGDLRGFKGSVYEGGLRVPAIVEWPAAIKPRVSKYPSCTMDIFPTIAEIVGLPESSFLQPQDGVSLRPLFGRELGLRSKPIPFRHTGRTALIDNDYKLIRLGNDRGKGKGKSPSLELYDLAADPGEVNNLSDSKPGRLKSMQSLLETWSESVDASVAGKDYLEGKVRSGHPSPRFWTELEDYKPFFDEWKKRPEYRSRLK